MTSWAVACSHVSHLLTTAATTLTVGWLYAVEPAPFVRNFTFKEIKRATDDFCAILGTDSHGVVYKARFPDGLVAEVRDSRKSGQEVDDFYKEVEALARLHHRHLVALQGFSKGRFLVFDYMQNGSLKDHLQDPLKSPLNWRIRLQIAIDVASALEYLQYFCDPPIYYDSINSGNVLLNDSFGAKLSAMGAFGPTGHSCPSSGDSSSSDSSQKGRHIIFQFGLLILELITGQSLGNEDLKLVDWVQESGLHDSLHNMVDADLGGNYDLKDLKRLVVIARLCTKNNGKHEISISQVLRFLERKVKSQKR